MLAKKLLRIPPALQNNRRYALYWAGLLISNTGSQMQVWAIFWHLRLLSDDPIVVSGIGIAKFLPILIFALVGGLVADTFDRRKVVLFTQTCMILIAAVLGVLTYFNSIHLWQIYILVAIQGIAVSFDGPSRQSMVPNIVPRKDLPSAFGMQSIAADIGAVVGPALCGLVIATLGLQWIYWINAVSFLAVILALIYMGPVPSPRSLDQNKNISPFKRLNFSEIPAGIRFITGHPIILSSMLLDFFATFFSSANTLMPFIATDVLHTNAIGYGWLSAAQSIGAVVVALVLALPLVILVVLGGLGLASGQVVLGILALAAALAVEWALRLRQRPRLAGHWGFLGAASICLGALGFLNTWDWPIYLALFAAATWVGSGGRPSRARPSLIVGIALGLGGFLAYLPFFLAFQSQASGVLPHYLSPTRLSQYLVMLGPLLLPAAVFALSRLRTSGRERLGVAGRWWLGLFAGPYAVLALVGLALLVLPAGREALGRLQGMEEIRALLEDGTWAQALARALAAKLSSPWMMLAVSAVLAAAVARLTSRAQAAADLEADERDAIADVALAMVGIALALTWAVEFVYLRDYFGTRMNTVFKFYYQAWVLLSLSGSFAAYYLWNRWRGPARAAFAVIAGALLTLGLVYAPLSLWTRTDGLTGPSTLDGTAQVERHRPEEAEALAWLRANVHGEAVILEAVGGSYTEFARVSAHTGVPTVLGWDFHEMQWRGTSEHSGRKHDVERLYTTRSWPEAADLLEAYDVRYVYIGRLERQAYGADAGALLRLRLPVAFQSSGSSDPGTILYVPPVLAR